MNCDCIAETKERLKTRMLEPDIQRPRKAGALDRVSCPGEGFAWKAGSVVLSVPFHIYWEGVKKPSEMNVIADFCPFCGKATKKEEA